MYRRERGRVWFTQLQHMAMRISRLLLSITCLWWVKVLVNKGCCQLKRSAVREEYWQKGVFSCILSQDWCELKEVLSKSSLRTYQLERNVVRISVREECFQDFCQLGVVLRSVSKKGNIRICVRLRRIVSEGWSQNWCTDGSLSVRGRWFFKSDVCWSSKELEWVGGCH